MQLAHALDAGYKLWKNKNKCNNHTFSIRDFAARRSAHCYDHRSAGRWQVQLRLAVASIESSRCSLGTNRMRFQYTTTARRTGRPLNTTIGMSTRLFWARQRKPNVVFPQAVPSYEPGNNFEPTAMARSARSQLAAITSEHAVPEETQAPSRVRRLHHQHAQLGHPQDSSTSCRVRRLGQTSLVTSAQAFGL